MKATTARGSVWVHQHGAGDEIVALHGFTQTGASFAELATLMSRTLVAPDLPGHGRTVVRPVDLDTALEAVDAVVAPRAPVPLLGYSQGGRLALHYSLLRPEAVSALVLLSTGPGSPDAAVRAQRRRADAALAKRLENEPLDDVLDEWLARPMFSGLGRRERRWRERDRDIRRTNSGPGLADALRGFGQGACPYVGDRLAELSMPALVMAGAEDSVYVAAGETMAHSIADVRFEVVEGAGHALVGETPHQVATSVRRLLDGAPPD